MVPAGNMAKRPSSVYLPYHKNKKIHHHILSEFSLNNVSMDRCWLLSLLRSGKVVGYKTEMPIPAPWILKKGELVANEGRHGN